jgi:hypothetical protein
MDKRRKVKNMVKKKANGNGYGVYSDYCTVLYRYAHALLYGFTCAGNTRIRSRPRPNCNCNYKDRHSTSLADSHDPRARRGG